MDDKLNKKIIILALCCLAVFILLFCFLVFFLNGSIGGKEYKIKLTTTPSGGHYKIGSIEGNTPSETWLKEGDYPLEITLEGYNKVQANITVSRTSEKTLHYNLTSSSLKAVDKISSKEVTEELKKSRAQYPYFDLLPYQTDTFYIDIPYGDGTIPVYVFKEEEAQGKEDALKWFKSHGVVNPAGLKISWRYSE